jgi:hypothetical protein
MTDESKLDKIEIDLFGNLFTSEEKVRKNIGKPKSRLGPKFPLFRLFDENDNLLYITKTLQLQSIATNEWFWDLHHINVKIYHDRGEQENAKFMAIQNESPKYNKNMG